LMEFAGIIVSSRFSIESELKKKHAYDEQSALTVDNCMRNFAAVIKIMEGSGLIGKTVDGKIYMTKKGKAQQLNGFSIKKIPPHTIVKFSRNK
jgi:hypothetical protein